MRRPSVSYVLQVGGLAQLLWRGGLLRSQRVSPLKAQQSCLHPRLDGKHVRQSAARQARLLCCAGCQSSPVMVFPVALQLP